MSLKMQHNHAILFSWLYPCHGLYMFHRVLLYWLSPLLIFPFTAFPPLLVISFGRPPIIFIFIDSPFSVSPLAAFPLYWLFLSLVFPLTGFSFSDCSLYQLSSYFVERRQEIMFVFSKTRSFLELLCSYLN